MLNRPPARSSLTVRTRPATRRSEDKRWIPVTAPFRPSASSASETVHESNRPKRAITVSTRLLPVRERHSVSRSRFRAIARDVVHFVTAPALQVHGRDDGQPVLDFRGADLEHVLRHLPERLLVAL